MFYTRDKTRLKSIYGQNVVFLFFVFAFLFLIQ